MKKRVLTGFLCLSLILSSNITVFATDENVEVEPTEADDGASIINVNEEITENIEVVETNASSQPHKAQQNQTKEPQEDPDDLVAEHDTDGDEHGESDKALVSDDSYFDKDGNNVAGATQFYINIDKDGDNDRSEIVFAPELVPVSVSSEIYCHYDIEWTVSRSSYISATVPLYVCMYGYGGSGNVITPSADKYSIKNESTYSDTKVLDSIIPYYIVTPILSQDDYVTDETREEYIEKLKESEAYKNENDADKKANMIKQVTDKDVYEGYIAGLKTLLGEDNIGNDEMSGDYGYYTVDKKSYTIVKLSKCSKHDSADSDCSNKDGYYIQGQGLDENTKVKGSDGKEYYKGYVLTAAQEGTYLPLNVPTIRTTASWALKSEDSIGSLKAKQLFMSINGLDLSEVNNSKSFGEAHTLNIKDLNWVVPAATDSNNPGTLNLPIKAAIAGGNVNDEGCVPVVRVTYLVSPAYDDSSLKHVYILPPEDES
jgi:hypothetical protein